MRGWKDGSRVKSTGYSSWRPEFNSQYRHGSLLLSVTLVLRVQCPRLVSLDTQKVHRHTCKENIYTTHTILKRQAQWHVPTTQLLSRLKRESCLSPVLQNQSRQHSEAHPRENKKQKTSRMYLKQCCILSGKSQACVQSSPRRQQTAMLRQDSWLLPPRALLCQICLHQTWLPQVPQLPQRNRHKLPNDLMKIHPVWPVWPGV